MGLKALLLIQGVIVATCLSTFVAARQLGPEPSASSPSASSSSSSSLCSRALATTLWGAAFAFFSLMADAWPASKAAASLWSEGHSLSDRLMAFFCNWTSGSNDWNWVQVYDKRILTKHSQTMNKRMNNDL